MKHILLTFALFIVVFSSLNAQSFQDSLKSELENTPYPDSILKEFRKNKLYTDSQNLVIANIGLDYAISRNLPLWEAKFLVKKANSVLRQGRLTEGIALALKAIQIMDANQLLSRKDRSNALLSISSGYQQLGAYKEAIRFRLEHVQSLDSNRYGVRYINSFNAIGLMYLEMNQYDSARLYYQKGLVYADHFGVRIRKAGTLNDIGLVYFEERNFDSAEVYFNRSLKLFSLKNTSTDSVMIGIVGGNLAKCFSIDGNKDRIIYLLNKNIEVARDFKYWSSVSNAYFDLGNLYYETFEYTKSMLYLDSSLMVSNTHLTSLISKEKKVDIYEAYVQIYKALGNENKAIRAMEVLVRYKDSLYGKVATEKLIQSISGLKAAGIQNELKLERALVKSGLEEIKILEAEEKLSRLKITLFVAIGLMLVVVFMLVILKIRSSHKKQKELDALSMQLLEASVEHKTKRLTQTALSLQRKKEFGQELIKKIAEIEGMDSRNISPIKLFVNNEIQMDESLIEMEQYVTELSKDFFVKVRLKFPDLTENDVKLCGLISLDLSIKEIAIIRNITPNSVKIAKNRLSKKMGLVPGTSLFQYLKSITPA